MDKNMEELLIKFKKIKNKGYINGNSARKNSSGIVFEKLLNCTGGNFYIPDFKDIEIKVSSYYEKNSICLFNSSPDGKYICPSQWLSRSFGYPDIKYNDIKVFKGDIYSTKYNKIGLKYYFKLHIDKLLKKIILEIYDTNHKLINEDIYWDFDSLKSKLMIKLKKLAIVNVKYIFINKTYYYFFKEIKLYKLKSFDHFIQAIIDGNISIKINTGVYKSGKNAGLFHDHGTTFKISKKNIEKLFTRIY